MSDLCLPWLQYFFIELADRLEGFNERVKYYCKWWCLRSFVLQKLRCFPANEFIYIEREGEMKLLDFIITTVSKWNTSILLRSLVCRHFSRISLDIFSRRYPEFINDRKTSIQLVVKLESLFERFYTFELQSKPQKIFSLQEHSKVIQQTRARRIISTFNKTMWNIKQPKLVQLEQLH